MYISSQVSWTFFGDDGLERGDGILQAHWMDFSGEGWKDGGGGYKGEAGIFDEAGSLVDW